MAITQSQARRIIGLKQGEIQTLGGSQIITVDRNALAVELGIFPAGNDAVRSALGSEFYESAMGDHVDLFYEPLARIANAREASGDRGESGGRGGRG